MDEKASEKNDGMVNEVKIRRSVWNDAAVVDARQAQSRGKCSSDPDPLYGGVGPREQSG